MNIFGVACVILQCTIFTMNLETPEQSKKLTDSIDNICTETKRESNHYEIDSRSSVDYFGSAHCTSSQTFDGSSETLPPIVNPNQPKNGKNFKTKLFGSRERSFRHRGLKNSHGYIMTKVLTSQGARCVIAEVKMHWTVAEIKKMLLYAQVIRTRKMHLKISENASTAISCDNALSETSGNIFELINENAKKVMAINHRCFIKIIKFCRVLARQNIAFQGASELNSNFHQILKFKSIGDTELTTWLSTRRYMSHDIQNEICTIMANHLLRQLVKDISPNFFLYFVTNTLTLQIRSSLHSVYDGSTMIYKHLRTFTPGQHV